VNRSERIALGVAIEIMGSPMARHEGIFVVNRDAHVASVGEPHI
jgi:hypothetical protein